MEPGHIPSRAPSWGANIRAERSRKGLNQADLGDLVGLSAWQVHAIETGRTPPRITTLLAIARALEIPLEALLREELCAA